MESRNIRARTVTLNKKEPTLKSGSFYAQISTKTKSEPPVPKQKAVQNFPPKNATVPLEKGGGGYYRE